MAQFTKSPANGWPGKATDFKYLKPGHNVWLGRSFEPDPKNAVAGHEPQSDSEPKPWTALMDPSGKQGPGRRPVAVVPTSGKPAAGCLLLRNGGDRCALALVGSATPTKAVAAAIPLPPR